MNYLRSTSGMGKLLVDGLDIGAVYYELDRNGADLYGQIGGKLSGEPHALAQAYKEGGATLVFKEGRKVPIAVTHLMKDDQVAVVQLKPKMVLQGRKSEETLALP